MFSGTKPILNLIVAFSLLILFPSSNTHPKGGAESFCATLHFGAAGEAKVKEETARTARRPLRKTMITTKKIHRKAEKQEMYQERPRKDLQRRHPFLLIFSKSGVLQLSNPGTE